MAAARGIILLRPIHQRGTGTSLVVLQTLTHRAMWKERQASNYKEKQT